ncbi:hypothetical protein FRX31_006139 [Thalictrum thalictroides]|uniref:Uncharacterized protein n=1 Tax=Thalictrum thalictroides TaxID=46969 RepID=A0A7J6X3H2_THATH|nr:hypothetical protein FRX31_006139 [Thalictrum thalictroides]
MAETKRISRRVKTDEMKKKKKGLTDLKDLVAAQQLMELSNSSSEESINSSSYNNMKHIKYNNMKNYEERSIHNDVDDGYEYESEVKVVETQIRQMKRKKVRSISDIYSRTWSLKI